MLRKPILLFYLLVCSLSLMAQKDLNTQLIGSWQLRSHGTADNKLPANPNDQNIYSFYKDSTFQQKIFYAKVQTGDSIKKNSLTVIFGRWRKSEVEDCLFLEQLHSRGDIQYTNMVDRYFCIGSLSDSIMIQKDNDIYNLYTKVPSIEKYQVDFVPGTRNVERIDYKFYLTNAANPKRRIELNYPNASTIYIQPQGADSLLSSFDHYYNGFIRDLNDSILKIDTYKETIYKNSGPGKGIKTSFEYSDEEGTDTTHSDHLRITSLKYIDYTSHGRNGINTLSGVGIFLSCGAIVAAPLIALNYKTFKINSEKFIPITLSGLLGLAVFIPINIGTNDKRYNIIRKDSSHDKYHWYLSKEED